MQLLTKVTLVLLSMLMTSCLPTGVALRLKIDEVETNIRVPVVIANHPAQKYSLADRMKYFETPGVSVAMIENRKNVTAADKYFS